MKFITAILVITLASNFNCSRQASLPGAFTKSSAAVIISEKLYQDAKNQSMSYSISEARIAGDSIKLKAGVTGYSTTWESRIKNLISSGEVMESMPPQMNLRLYISADKNDPISSAFGYYDLAFDLKPLRQKGYNKISLNLDGGHGPLMYEY